MWARKNKIWNLSFSLVVGSFSLTLFFFSWSHIIGNNASTMAKLALTIHKKSYRTNKKDLSKEQLQQLSQLKRVYRKVSFDEGN
jgi:hypothetical protein